jgi:hypothetical protein
LEIRGEFIIFYTKLNYMDISELAFKLAKGEELTIEEELYYQKRHIDYLMKQYEVLTQRVQELEEGNNGNEPKNSKGVHTIKEVYFLNEYEYKNKKFASFMVKLEGEETLYQWDRLIPVKNPITAGETIYCEIDNEKLRNVKVLQNI